jgi:hypothetical protein
MIAGIFRKASHFAQANVMPKDMKQLVNLICKEAVSYIRTCDTASFSITGYLLSPLLPAALPPARSTTDHTP